MQITFPSSRLRKLCASRQSLVRKFGSEGARKIQQRLSLLEAADTLEDLRVLPGRCHELGADRKGQLALDLHQGFRLVFCPAGDWRRKNDGGLDWSSVSAVEVIEISDHYS